MKNLTDIIKESKAHPTISKSGYFLMVFDAPVTPVKNKGKVYVCSDESELFNYYDKFVGDHYSIESDVYDMKNGDALDYTEHGKYVIIQVFK